MGPPLTQHRTPRTVAIAALLWLPAPYASCPAVDGDPTRRPNHHQQYLAKNPGGYCGLGGTGVACPAGLASAE